MKRAYYKDITVKRGGRDGGSGTMNAKTTKTETPKAACRTTRGHIARLMKMLEAELNDREMTEDTWPVAGSLGHVRELLAETVGFLKGVEGSEIVEAMINKSR